MSDFVSQNIVSQNIVSQNIVSQNIVSNNTKTTLSPDYPCDDCGEPSMVYVGKLFYCPKCYLKKQGAKIKPLDHAGFYP
jgi:hypothetical protein